MGVIDDFDKGGPPGWEFENLGDKQIGTIVKLDKKQDADYTTELPLWWQGKKKTTENFQGAQPVMVLILTLQSEPEGPDDDGLRSLWCRGHKHIAVMAAFRDALKGEKLTDSRLIGGVLELQHHELGEKRPKMEPAKLFRGRFTPPQVIDSVAKDDEGW